MKFDKSKDIKPKQYSNMLSKLFTFEVSNFDRSNDSKLLQERNTEFISFTFDVSKFPNIIDFKEEQPSNMLLIFSTSELSKSEKSISVITEQILNIFSQLFNGEENLNLILLKDCTTLITPSEIEVGEPFKMTSLGLVFEESNNIRPGSVPGA